MDHIKLFMNISQVCMLVATLLVIGISLFPKRTEEGTLKLKGFRVWTAALGVIFALVFWHYSVLCYEIEKRELPISGVEVWGASLVKTAKAFGLDENLDSFLEKLDCTLRSVGVTSAGCRNWAGAYTTMLFVLAPILGGIGLLEVLAGLFPRIKLFFAGLVWFKDKYYFSELNDGSLEMARSICRVDMGLFTGFKRPTLIFTNVDASNDEAGNIRRVSEAKALGAICLRTDLKNVPMAWFGKKKYLLLEENETSVLQQLSELDVGTNYKKLKGAEIFFSATTDAYEPFDKQIREKLKPEFVDKVESCVAEIKKKEILKRYPHVERGALEDGETLGKIWDYIIQEEKKAEEKAKASCEKKTGQDEKTKLEKKLEKFIEKKQKPMPCLTPVRTNFSLIMDLLTKIPLFEPLIGRPKKDDGTHDLVVSIIGAGGLGMEMFLNTYWIGQMLDCNLIVNVYSQEPKEDFEARLDHINPEILETTKPGNKHLYIDSNGKRVSKPYCTVNYVQCQLGSGDLKTIAKGVEESDYCLVALGSDMDNIDMAARVRRCVGEYHITHQDARTVIAYVVYDPKTAEVLNREKRHTHIEKGGTDVFMQAIGTLQEVYSLRNVFMADVAEGAESAHKAYQAIRNLGNRKKENLNRFKKSTVYEYWANIARVEHEPYKLYSTGKLENSLFTCQSDAELAEKRNEESQKARQILGLDQPDAEYTRLIHRMAWLEHRRWNAFTRIMGYRSTKLLESYYSYKQSHKFMELRLHPCLVECDEAGIRSGLDEELYPIWKDLSYLETANRDLLDDLSFCLYQKLVKKGKASDAYDFKFYDYFKYSRDEKKDEQISMPPELLPKDQKVTVSQ